MSFIRRLWQKIKPSYFVGRDLEGNSFYEYPSTTEDVRRTKRVVKYQQGRDMWHYIASGRRLPIQWSAWLTHTRHSPPTLQELQADLERQKRVRMNAALIEARDRDAQTAVRDAFPAEPQYPEVASASFHPTEGNRKVPVSSDITPETPQEIVPESPQPPNPWIQVGSDEPQSWIPRTARRTGS